jgi:predicted dehydrogenase/nucleoside-diphosphate-sugar epimerase
MKKDRDGTAGPFRVALFGAGKMAMHHAKAIRLQGNATLIAVADPALGSGETPKELGGGVAVYTSAEELLKQVKPDLVHVCSPPETHASLAKLALRHGAHVYVEKPFALNAVEAMEVLSFAKAAGLGVCAGHQLLYEAPTLLADEISSKLGRIVHIESYFAFKPVRRSRDGRAAISALDQLVDILPHPVYLLLHYLERNSPQANIPVEIRSMEVKSSGSVHGILRRGDVTGTLSVTLEGRPVDSYIKLVGTNGCLTADFVRGTVIALPGPGISTIAKVLSPYQQSRQMISKTTRALFRRLTGKQKSYPGLLEIISGFYQSLQPGEQTFISHSSIVETVAICEEAAKKLRAAEREGNEAAQKTLDLLESELLPPNRETGGVLVTGGTGMLGTAAARELRGKNRFVRVVARSIPPAAMRIPGVEYASADLSKTISQDILRDISIVVHCAAETAGGKEAHERNSVGATRNLVIAMQAAGVKDLIHISSLAVLKTSRETGGPVDEDTPLALGGDDRGPYVWGKAGSERLLREECGNRGVRVRVIRPGPLVDYDGFEPPGRLGREVGPFFVMVGSKKSRLSLCTVATAAEVIRHYVEDFDSMPPVLNLIEPDAPTRGELVSRLLQVRPDLKTKRIPSSFLRVASPPLKWLQRLLRPGNKPVDIYAAFASETYKSELAAKIIQLSKASSRPNMEGVA